MPPAYSRKRGYFDYLMKKVKTTKPYPFTTQQASPCPCLSVPIPVSHLSLSLLSIHLPATQGLFVAPVTHHIRGKQREARAASQRVWKSIGCPTEEATISSSRTPCIRVSHASLMRLTLTEQMNSDSVNAGRQLLLPAIASMQW
jgi:hypothetical protein